MHGPSLEVTLQLGGIVDLCSGYVEFACRRLPTSKEPLYPLEERANQPLGQIASFYTLAVPRPPSTASTPLFSIFRATACFQTPNATLPDLQLGQSLCNMAGCWKALVSTHPAYCAYPSRNFNLMVKHNFF